MHSSYALASTDFAVERDGASRRSRPSGPGFAPTTGSASCSRSPMDACGCSNLICGTNTLFYDDLREARRRRQLLPLRRHVPVRRRLRAGRLQPARRLAAAQVRDGALQPTAEALIEMINDRRITLLAIPETGARCRGEVMLSTWNTFCETVRCVVTYSPRTGKARGAGETAWSATGSSSRTSSRRSSRRRASAPASRRGSAACGATSTASRCSLRRGVPHAAERGRRAGAARGDEVLPPGHQELSRRATPTTIVPVEQPLPPLDLGSAPI